MLLLIVFILLNSFIFGQGLIINEFSNGASNSREYIELVVVPNPASPCQCVNIGGWIIDDNNGDFESIGSGTGIAAGHFRFKPGCLPCMAPGTIILIYNANELIFSVDSTDSNNDGVYILPHTTSCLQVCTTQPTTTNSSYIGSTYTNTGSTSWSTIGLANSGDAVQVRRPNGTFFHGLAYGDVTTIYPIMASQFGSVSSFNIASGSGTNSTYSYLCGNMTSSNFIKTDTIPSTPGAVNTTTNGNFIQNLKNCSVDWNNLSNSNNCDLVLPIEWINLKIKTVGVYKTISWDLVSQYIIQEYINDNWINTAYKNNVAFISNSSLFRVLALDYNANWNYSPVLESINNDNNITYNNGILNITNINNSNIVIYNLLGQCIYKSNTEVNIELKGLYIIQINDKIIKYNCND